MDLGEIAEVAKGPRHPNGALPHPMGERRRDRRLAAVLAAPREQLGLLRELVDSASPRPQRPPATKGASAPCFTCVEGVCPPDKRGTSVGMSGASAVGDSAAGGGGRAAEVWFTVPEAEHAAPERDKARVGDAEATVVRLEIPAETRVVRAARLVASGLTSAAGFDVDDVDDIRIAVDELCAVLFELGDGGVVSVTFTTRPGEIEVQGQTAASEEAVDPSRFALSVQILNAACDEFSWSMADGIADVRIAKRLRRGDPATESVVRRFPARPSGRRPPTR